MNRTGDPRQEERLLRRMAKTCAEYELLAKDDQIMVAISGGKDSYTMLHLLHRLKSKLPFPIRLIAVHLDQKQPGYDGAPLRSWLESQSYDYEILAEDTYSVVVEHVPEDKTYCSLCSRLRRGVLYTAAERLGCNKIALGHHREDTLETLLLNLFYAGKMQAMPAKYTTDDQRFEVIRPLIETAEADIERFAESAAFPIIPCNLCGSQPNTSRKQMKAMLTEMEAKNPNVRQVMLNALRNVRPTHLLDHEVQRAWAERPTDIPAKQAAQATESHFDAQPALSGHGRLRVIS